MKRLIIILLCTAMFSCKPVIKTVYGIKKPRLEQKNDLRNFLHNYDVDTTRMVFFKDFPRFIQASQAKYLSFPDAMFFNAEGQFVDYNKSATDCNAGVDAFLTDLHEFQNRVPDSSRTRQHLDNLITIKPNTKPAAITVYITFAKYVGRLNKDKAFEWVSLIEKAQKDGVDIQYYLINCDFLKSWNIPPQFHKQFGIKS